MKRKTSRAGVNVADQIVESLRDFTEALERGDDIAARYTVRTVKRHGVPTPFDAQGVQAVRKLLGASQAVFAWFLGVKVQTVQAWEQGRNPPPGSACRLMELVRDRPEFMRKRLRELAGENRHDGSKAG